MRYAAALAVAFGLAGCGGGKGKGTEPVIVGAEPGSGSGSGSAPAGEAPTATPAPTGFAEADAITIDGGELVTWSFAGGKATRLGSIKLASPDPEDYTGSLRGDWADRDHFFVLIPPRTVKHVSAQGVVDVTVPPESEFKVPKPAVDNSDDLSEGGVMERTDTGLVVGGGEAWWSECPWGFPYDGWQCEVYVSSRLWPTPKSTTEKTGVAPRRWDWTKAPIKGWKLKELDEGRMLGCNPPPGTKQRQTKLEGQEEEERVYAAEWVSSDPARLLLIWGTPGYADLVPMRWELHDGCLEKTVGKGEDATPGPAPYWLGDGVLYHGADNLGPIPGDVRFRPPT